ncbi:Uncharacterised protein [Mycobacteroides abscessus]|nr:Uncharacterised protein [Mycobacteroides abscessus]
MICTVSGGVAGSRVNVDPSNSPTKYWAVDPFVSSESPSLTVSTQRTSSGSPSTGRGNRSGHSHTAECSPCPSPNMLSSSQCRRSGEPWSSTPSPTETTMTHWCVASCQKTFGSRKSPRPSLGITGLSA